MRPLLFVCVAWLCASCLFKRSSTVPPDEIVTRVALTDDAIYVETYWDSIATSPWFNRHLRISLSSRACTILRGKPEYPRRRDATRSFAKELRFSNGTILRKVDVVGERYLEVVGKKGTRRFLLPRGEHLAWVVGAPLVLVDDTVLLNIHSGNTLDVHRRRHDPMPFAIRGQRLYLVEDGDLVVRNFQLDVVRRLAPRLTLYKLGRAAGVDHVFLDRVGNDAGWTWVRGYVTALTGFAKHEKNLAVATWRTPQPLDARWHEVAPRTAAKKTEGQLHITTRADDGSEATATYELRGIALWAEGASLIIGDHWLFNISSGKVFRKPPGAVAVSTDVGPQYLRTASGDTYHVQQSRLSRVPSSLGDLRTSNRHGILLSSPRKGIIWLLTSAGEWRYFSYNRCDLERERQVGIRR